MDLTAATEARAVLVRVMGGWASLLMIRGFVLLALGLFALFNPTVTVVVLAQLIGAYIIVEGAVAFYRVLTRQVDGPIWELLRGVVLAIVGLAALLHPAIVVVVNTGVATALVGIGSVVSGVVEVFQAVRQRQQIEGEGLLVVGGLLSILFGLVVLAYPLLAALVFMRLLAAVAVVGGMGLAAVGVRIQGIARILAGR